MTMHNTEYCRRKADQEWEMAALAKADGDSEDELRHFDKANYWEQQAMLAAKHENPPS